MTLSASSLGLRFLTPYYLPLITSLMLILRCVQTNNTNRRSVNPLTEVFFNKSFQEVWGRLGGIL